MKIQDDSGYSYTIPVPQKQLIALFKKEYSGMEFSKADARGVLRYLQADGRELYLDVLTTRLYMLDDWDENSELEHVELHELISICADRNYDLQEDERAKERPDKARLAALKKDNSRFDRLVERMSV